MVRSGEGGRHVYGLLIGLHWQTLMQKDCDPMRAIKGGSAMPLHIHFISLEHILRGFRLARDALR